MTTTPMTAAARRLQRLREKLAEFEIDGALITNAENRRYLSGFSGSAGTLLITPTEAVIATDFRYYEQAGQQAAEYRLHKTIGPLAVWFGEMIGDMGGKRLGFEGGDVSFNSYRSYTKAVESLPEGRRPRLTATTGLVEGLRVYKDAEEMAALQAAIDLGDAANAHVQAVIAPGWTEKQVAWEIEKYIREHGGDGLSFPTIIAGGPHSALPHAQPRDYVLNEGDMVVIDMGCALNGYMSDLTRTVFIGKPDDKFRRAYDVVATAQRTAIETIEAGMTGEQAHMQAHAVIEAAGMGELFGHGLGHGIGMQVHEMPRVARTSPDVLRDGMVFSVEPGVYIPGWGGIRIEDLGVLENGKLRMLSKAPYWQE